MAHQLRLLLAALRVYTRVPFIARPAGVTSDDGFSRFGYGMEVYLNFLYKLSRILTPVSAYDAA